MAVLGKRAVSAVVLFWRTRFGATTNPGSGSGLGGAALPKPSSLVIFGMFVSIAAAGRNSRHGVSA